MKCTFAAVILTTLVAVSFAALIGTRRGYPGQEGFLSPGSFARPAPNFAEAVLGSPGVASTGYGTPGFGGSPLSGSPNVASPAFGALDSALRGVAAAPVAVAGPNGAAALGVAAGPGGASAPGVSVGPRVPSANGLTAVPGEVTLTVPMPGFAGPPNFGRSAAF